MAGAVVIQQQSPLGAAADAVSGYVQQKQTNQEKALALALERQKMANDERYRQRSLDLQQSAVESQNHARDVQTKIAEADAAYQEKVRPILYQLAQAQLQGATDENRLKAAQAQVAELDVQTQQKLVQLGLPVAEAQAHLKQLQQSIATSVAQQHASEAQTNRTNALLPGEVAQQGALTNLYGAEAIEARQRGAAARGGGFAQEKFNQEENAAFEVGKGTVDDALRGGTSPEDVIKSIRTWKTDSATKLRLIRYVQSQPRQHAQAPQGGGGFMGGVDNFLKAHLPSAQTLTKTNDAVRNLAIAVALGGPGTAAVKAAASAVWAAARAEAGAVGESAETLIARAVRQPQTALSGGTIGKTGPATVNGPGGGPIEQPGGFENYGIPALPPGKGPLSLPSGGPIEQPGLVAGQPGSGVSALEELMRRALGL